MRNVADSRNDFAQAARPATSLVASILGAGIVLFLALHWKGSWAGWWLENIPIFRSAISEWLAGRSPYTDQVAPLYYIYPPIFIYVAGAFVKLVSPPVALVLYLCAHFAATLALPLLLARYVLRQPWLTPMLALMVFFVGPLYQAGDALFTCNIATLLYFVVFAAAVPGIQKNRWVWFYLAVIAVALVKFTLLPLLLLPLFAGRSQWLRSTLTGGVACAAYVTQKAAWPDLYKGYLWAVQQCVVLPVHYGFGVFGMMARVWSRLTGHVGLVPYAVLGVLGGALFLSLLLMRRRFHGSQDASRNGVWLAMIVSAVILMNPRLMPYDADVAVFCSFVLLVYALRIRRPLLCWAMCFLPSLAVMYLVDNVRMRGVYTTVLILAAYAAGYWRMWRETAVERSREQAKLVSLTVAAEAQR